MVPKLRRKFSKTFATGILLIAAHAAGAQDMSFGASVGVGSTDNIFLTPEDNESETIATAGLTLDVDHDGAKLDAKAKGEFSYQDYLGDTYDDDLLGRLDALLRFDMVPERFAWVAQENFGQLQIDPVAALSPQNREDVNYFSTGPDLNLHFGSQLFATFTGRYSLANYETSPLDGDRTLLTAALGRELADTARVSLNVTREQFEFDDAFNEDYDRSSVFVNYTAEGARTEIDVDVGQTRVEKDSGDFDGSLARLTLSRKMSSAATLIFEGGTSLTDASDSFRNLASGAPGSITTGPNAASPETFRRKDAALTWRYLRNRTTIAANAQWADDRYRETAALNVTRTSYLLTVERVMSHALTGRIFATRVTSEYDNLGFEDQLWSGGAELMWSLGRNLSLNCRYEHTDRDADGAGFDYDENRAFLTLAWRQQRR